jgi:hypothetical protein
MGESLAHYGRASSSRAWVVRASLALCLSLSACGNDVPPTPVADQGQQPSENNDRNFEDGLYERNVVFMTVDADSAIVVPWLFRASSSETSVERSTQGWLARAGLWEPFFLDHWTTEPTRTAFRIQPRGPMDLVVGDDGSLERILFSEGQRQLGVVIDEGMSDWRGNRGETFRVHRGAALFGDQRIEGIVLDMNRARLREGPEPGDWLFLTGPRRLAILVHSPDGSSNYTAWGRMGEDEFRWPSVRVEWTAVRSFEEARRDVPVEWEIRSLGTDVRGGVLIVTLASTGMELQALEGGGPILPVDGLFQVDGSVVLAGETLEVRGLVRHVQR